MPKRKVIDLREEPPKKILCVLNDMLEKNKGDFTCMEVGRHLCYSDSLKTCPITIIPVPNNSTFLETLLCFWELKYNLDSYINK